MISCQLFQLVLMNLLQYRSCEGGQVVSGSESGLSWFKCLVIFIKPNLGLDTL